MNDPTSANGSAPPPPGDATGAAPEDHLLARRLAREAGAMLVALRARMATDGADPRSLRTAGDRDAHDLLMHALADRLAAGDAVLSEEGRDDPVRLERRRVWIVDPLDGTREFGEPPRSDWAVHVALAIDGRPAAGAVALPALGLTLATDEPPVPPPPPSGPPRVVVSRSRPPREAEWVAERLGASLLEMGSAGAKAMAVVRGEADVYVHSGGQYEWDSCAPVAVALAAGLHATRLDGAPLRYNQPDVSLPDLVICRPELAAPVRAALDAFEG